MRMMSGRFGIRAAQMAVSCLLAAHLCSHVAYAAERRGKPNVIIILVDDLGYSDVGAYGAQDVKTPHIDSLAESGCRFTNAYATCPVCTPARAALLTGRYQQRTGLEWGISPDSKTGVTECGLDEKEKTIADLLKEEGYVTGALGKWHLGDQPKFFPTARGFDCFYGFLQGGHFFLNTDESELANPTNPIIKYARTHGGDRVAESVFRTYNAPIYRNEKIAGFEGYLTDVLNREAVAFIEQNKDRPFFLYLAHAGQHVPLQATEKYLSRFPSLNDDKLRKTYAAALSAIDDGVGDISAKLKELNLYDNTIIIFTSDNGGASFWEPRPEILDVIKAGAALGAPKNGETPDFREVSTRYQWAIGANGADNRPLSFGKGILYEGGIRVPLIIRWPGVANADKSSDAIVSHLDILPTAISAAGGKLPGDRAFDGKDLRPCLQDAPGAYSDRTLFWRVWKDRAVRSGKWKLVWSGEADPRLYDLSNDLEERNDLAPNNRAIVEMLQNQWTEWNKNNVDPRFQWRGR